jgi:hypothetical protein
MRALTVLAVLEEEPELPTVVRLPPLVQVVDASQAPDGLIRILARKGIAVADVALRGKSQESSQRDSGAQGGGPTYGDGQGAPWAASFSLTFPGA